MIIDNEKEKMSNKTKIILGVGIGVVLIAIIGGVLLLNKKDNNVNKDLGDKEQLEAVVKEYLPDYTGGVSARQEDLEKAIEDNNKAVTKSSGNRFTAKTIKLSDFEGKTKYYRDRTQTEKVPEYITEEEIKEAEENISDKIKLIIQLDGEDYKERITKTALKVEEKIVDQNAYNKCKNNGGFGVPGEDVGEEDLSENAGSTSSDTSCGVEYTKSEYLGDEYSASILGGIVYGYKQGNLDNISGLDLKTFRELSTRASWWLENTKYPYPFYSTMIEESKFYNNAILSGYWKELDFENITNLIVKESNSMISGGYYKIVYDVAFQSGDKWYKADIVEENQDLRLYDIRYVK